MSDSSPILGIDLGTTNTVYSIMNQLGEPEVLKTDKGHRKIPSVVYIDENERLVGKKAKSVMKKSPQNSVRSIKRHMGEQGYTVELDGDQHTPEEISAMILKKTKEEAEERLRQDIKDVVITVPAYFNDRQRQATKNAGRIAGLNVRRIVNEPTAAAMAYGLYEERNETVMVYDLGGGTFDISILTIDEGVFDVVATSGDSNLGGDDWDQVIMDWLMDEFEEEHGFRIEGDDEAMLGAKQRFYEEAEAAKKKLSNQEEVEINMPFLFAADDQGGIHLTRTLTREKFEEMSEHLLNRTTPPIEDALESAGMEMHDLDKVLLVGGATKMPMVRKKLEGYEDDINPDEVVAKGAAIQGGIITGEVESAVLLDVTPLSLGVEVKGGLFEPVIQKNTTVPTEQHRVYSTSQDNQTSVSIRVFQGEREIAEDNIFLDEFTLAGIPPQPAGVPQIRVNFSIDENGIVHVEAEEMESGRQEGITIEGGVGLTDEEIEDMKLEAEIMREQDIDRRRQLEAINHAERLLNQAEKYLDQKYDEPEERQSSEMALTATQIRDTLNRDEKEIDPEQLERLNENLQEMLENAAGALNEYIDGLQGS